MAAELVTLPSTVVSGGPDATELVVAFRVSERMSQVAVGVHESSDEILVTVEAAWNGCTEASGGWFPYFCHSSSVVQLDEPVGTRRLRAVPDSRHVPGIC